MPGLVNTTVIPADWQQHHRPVTEQAMTATCIIVRPTSAGTWNPTAGATIYPDPVRVYPMSGAAPCRITRRPSHVTKPETGDRIVPVATYTISVAADTSTVQVGDLIQVVTCPGDPALTGRDLVVRDSDRGSLTWQRDLTCDLYPTTTR
jgi:hypothetical protein